MFAKTLTSDQEIFVFENKAFASLVPRGRLLSRSSSDHLSSEELRTGLGFRTGFARFFLIQHTKTIHRKNILRP
jgi:hypothetical protein